MSSDLLELMKTRKSVRTYDGRALEPEHLESLKNYAETITVILNYLNSHYDLAMAVFCEVFFGAMMNAINVMGDIVTVVTKETGVRRTS